jgi:hypothetical protein
METADADANDRKWSLTTNTGASAACFWEGVFDEVLGAGPVALGDDVAMESGEK